MDVRETTELDEDERIITIADGSDTGIVNENCEPSEIGKQYKDDPAMRLTEAIVPVIIESEAVQDTFEWARFINENGIADEILNHPVVRLAEKLFNKHRLLDYHRILFDIPYR